MSVAEHIRRATRRYADNLAAICGDERRTHAEIGERSNRLANALLARGLAHGDRVVVLLENSIRCIEVDFALCKAGLVRVSLNPRITAAELAYICDDAEPRAIICGSNFLSLILPALRERSGIAHVVCVNDIAEIAVPEEWLDYDALLAAGAADPPSAAVAAEDLHSIAYTSGSTGKPKGVMLSHRAIAEVAYNVLLELGPEGPGEKVLLLQPLSHGSAYFVLAYYMRGCAIVLMRRFDAERALDLVRELGIETVKLVPTMLQRMLALPGFAEMPLPKLRQIVYGGSHIATEVLRKAITILGPRLAQHYGQTEAPSIITLLPRHDHTLENVETGLLGSAGRAAIRVDVKVVDENGARVHAGEIGELLVRAPHAMSGYWRRPEQSAAAMRDGWLRTNDLARMDEREYVYLLGRQDEMIISGGYNIAPREVADALCTHPGVSEAAVFGRPDREWGQAVVAVVALKDTGVNKAQLFEYTRSVLGYKRPKDILVVDELPKNANGKIDMPALKRAFGSA
jgi:long-chain acyl-CoA synthetase